MLTTSTSLSYFESTDLEAKQVHKEALEALTSIEVEFATLRDRYVGSSQIAICFDLTLESR